MIWKVFTCNVADYPAKIDKIQEDWNILMIQFSDGVYHITCNRPIGDNTK